jgi:hypothetical protein
MTDTEAHVRLAAHLGGASASFMGAYWTHERGGESGWGVLCEGAADLDTCDTCARAAAAASEAELLGQDALSAARDGDWDRALGLVDAAHGEEHQFGDAPSYGPALDFVRAYVSTLKETA